MKHRLLCLICLIFSSNCFAKEIALTFDDSPRSASGYLTGPQRAQMLIKALKDSNVEQVAFFANSKGLNVEGTERLTSYSQAGHIIANHTHDHLDFNKTSLEDFSENFLLADQKLRQFENYTKLFRFPYLRAGNTLKKRDGMREVLKAHGYTHAYITLNNYDWYIETLFQNAIKNNKNLDLEQVKDFYVKVMMESIEFYDLMANTYMNRSPKHVLLLHEMDISALFIGDLVKELRLRGWKIISPQQAYTDELAKYQPKKVFRFSPGKVGELARELGQKKGLWHQSLNEKYLDKLFKKEVLSE